MSGADKLKDKIMEEARLQAEAILKKAEDEAAALIDAAEQEAAAKRKEIIEKAKLEAVEVKKRLIAVSELESRKQKLKAKQEMVDEAFNKALDKLGNLPLVEYQTILSEMIVNSITSGNEEIILRTSDRTQFSRDFIENINKKLAAKGIKGNVKLSEESRDIKSGFILKSGDIEINNSFEAIIRMKRDEIEPDVIKMLF